MSSSVTNHSRYLASHLDPARPGSAYEVMPKRGLGGTGIMVGALGLGTAALSRLEGVRVPDEEAIYLIGQSLDMQANFVDLAPTYGAGRGLSLVGRAIKDRRRQAVLSLKAGYFADGHTDFSAAGLRKSLEQSLKALGTDHVDVLLLHNPSSADLLNAETWGSLGKLKDAGKILDFGASLTTADELKAALDKTPAQVLQFPYNAFAQDNGALFDQALAKGVGLVANRVLDSGWLAGAYGPLSLFMDSRKRWSHADKERRSELQQALEGLVMRSGITAAQAAIAFVLAQPQISCALVGASEWQQVVGNVGGAHTRLEPAVVAKVKELWEKRLKASPLPL